MSTKTPGAEWDRVQNRGAESHTFGLIWWAEADAADRRRRFAGGQHAAHGTYEAEKG